LASAHIEAMSQALINDCCSCTVCCHSLWVIELDKPAGILALD